MLVEASRRFQGLKLIIVIIFTCHNVKTGLGGMLTDHVLFMNHLLNSETQINFPLYI
jgi:hypothetical protein